MFPFIPKLLEFANTHSIHPLQHSEDVQLFPLLLNPQYSMFVFFLLFLQGVTFPAATAIVSRWSPKLERSIISSIVFSGAQMGNVITMSVSGWLSSTNFLGGWPSVFYVFGMLNFINDFTMTLPMTLPWFILSIW